MTTLLLALLISTHTVGELKQAQAKPETYQCFTKALGTMLYAKEQTVNGHRVNVQGFARQGEQQDILLVYEYVGTNGQLRPFPTVYMFDTDQDGDPDAEYLDSKGDGRCADMAQIPVGSAFTGKRL
jgi:hypothetical protein